MRTESWGAHLPANWRLLRSVPATGVANMAVDATLLATAAGREFGVWRTYGWVRPTISFGRNEAVRTRFDAESLAASGFDAVRRPTGGRALLHAAEVTYSVTLPLESGTPWQRAYHAINHVLHRALAHLGVPASIVGASSGTAVRPTGPVCFDAPSAGEITVGGAKLVGSAVWRERGSYLQHGSILLEDHQHRLSDAMISPGSPPPRAASLADCLPVAPTWGRVADALEASLREFLSTRHDGGVSTDTVSLDATLLAHHESRFADPCWLWRR